MSEYRGIAKWAEDAVGMINWDNTAKEGTAQVTDETTGTVYAIGGGGGGESDFSTAQLTFLNSLGEGDRQEYHVAIISVLSDGIGYDIGPVERNGQKVVTVPLYKGKISITAGEIFGPDLDSDIMPQLTGSAEVTDSYLVITGDCSINAAGASGI